MVGIEGWRFSFGARKLLGFDLPSGIHGQNAFLGQPGKEHPDCGHMLLLSCRRARVLFNVCRYRNAWTRGVLEAFLVRCFRKVYLDDGNRAFCKPELRQYLTTQSIAFPEQRTHVFCKPSLSTQFFFKFLQQEICVSTKADALLVRVRDFSAANYADRAYVSHCTHFFFNAHLLEYLSICPSCS